MFFLIPWLEHADQACAAPHALFIACDRRTWGRTANLLSRSQLLSAELDKRFLESCFGRRSMPVPIWFIAPAVIICATALVVLALVSMGAW
jgi:hypothetical protein